jgi:hypothetical protein
MGAGITTSVFLAVLKRAAEQWRDTYAHAVNSSAAKRSASGSGSGSKSKSSKKTKTTTTLAGVPYDLHTPAGVLKRLFGECTRRLQSRDATSSVLVWNESKGQALSRGADLPPRHGNNGGGGSLSGRERSVSDSGGGGGFSRRERSDSDGERSGAGGGSGYDSTPSLSARARLFNSKNYDPEKARHYSSIRRAHQVCQSRVSLLQSLPAE